MPSKDKQLSEMLLVHYYQCRFEKVWSQSLVALRFQVCRVDTIMLRLVSWCSDWSEDWYNRVSRAISENKFLSIVLNPTIATVYISLHEIWWLHLPAAINTISRTSKNLQRWLLLWKLCPVQPCRADTLPRKSAVRVQPEVRPGLYRGAEADTSLRVLNVWIGWNTGCPGKNNFMVWLSESMWDYVRIHVSSRVP